MKHRIVSQSDKPALRFFTVGGHECIDRAILFNGGPRDFRDRLFAIHAPLGNFSHCLGILWSEGDHEVLNDACDAGLLDSLRIPDADYAAMSEDEREDVATLGNASEPFDLSDMTTGSVVEIPAKDWQADWEFVHALGRCAGGETIETAAAL